MTMPENFLLESLKVAKYRFGRNDICELDQHVIEGIRKRLLIDQFVSKAFNHGQIRRAASFVVRECGYEWALSNISGELSSGQKVMLRRKIRRIVENVVTSQGKIKTGVWHQFRAHARRIACGIESRVILKRIALSD